MPSPPLAEAALLLLLSLVVLPHAALAWWAPPALGRVPTALADGPERVYTRDLLSLESIRESISRLEESVIWAALERAQWRANSPIYRPGAVNDTLTNPSGTPVSFLEYMLRQTETRDALVRRYQSPEEHAFFPRDLPPPMLPALDYAPLLAPHDVNVNDEVMQRYVDELIPAMCEAGDDEQYGSSVLCDINLLQALSRRVHLGKFVAESKFADSPEEYRGLLERRDTEGVLRLLTNTEVERKVLERARLKAARYATDVTKGGCKLDPSLIVWLYRDMIIPLTKKVEVMYLYQRIGLVPPPEEEYMHICLGDTRSADVSPSADEP